MLLRCTLDMHLRHCRSVVLTPVPLKVASGILIQLSSLAATPAESEAVLHSRSKHVNLCLSLVAMPTVLSQVPLELPLEVSHGIQCPISVAMPTESLTLRRQTLYQQLTRFLCYVAMPAEPGTILGHAPDDHPNQYLSLVDKGAFPRHTRDRRPNQHICLVEASSLLRHTQDR